MAFQKKDQQLILQKITSTLFPNKKTKQGKGSKPLFVPSPNVTISELLGKYKDGIPELEGEEEIKKRCYFLPQIPIFCFLTISLSFS